MAWDGAATEKKIWSGAKKDDNTYDVSFIKQCYLKGPDGDPQLKGSWSYPYRGSPDEKPNCQGLLAAEQRAKGTGNDMKIAQKARSLRVKNCGAVSEQSEICLNSGTIQETDSEIIVNCAVMHAGVYNGKLKTPEALQESLRWWNGIPIVIENTNEINDHPETGITTSKTVRVGQLLNPLWDAQNVRVNAEAHFVKDLTPEWLQDDLRNRKVMGVSGAYFCDFLEQNGQEGDLKYDGVELNYVPNNLAIVKKPACKPPECGLNVNSMTVKLNVDTEEFTKKLDELIDKTSVIKNNVEEITMEQSDKKIDELTVQINSKDDIIKEKDQQIATLQAEKIQLNAMIEDFKAKEAAAVLEAKKAKFLAQFPEENRAKAEAELLPMFLEKPEELILNANKMADLMTVYVTEQKTAGQSYVKVEQNKEDEEGVPSIDDVKKAMGLA